MPGKESALRRALSFKNLSLAVVLLIYSIIIVGGYVTATGAATACEIKPTIFPLCNGSLVPDISLPGVAQEYLHRQLTFWGGFVILVWRLGAWGPPRRR